MIGYLRVMDLRDFLDRYIDDIYAARNPAAASAFIADPCLRHEHGELIVMSLEQNIARITKFIADYPIADFTNRLVLVDGEHVASVFDVTVGEGAVISAVEVFRVVEGKITETWNSLPGTGAWG